MTDALAMFARVGAEALAAEAPEPAMRAIVRGCFETLGDRDAHRRPGALKPGERDYSVAGCFLVTPDRQHHLLVGNVGFPPEQARLRVPIDGGHPGRVYATQRPLLLADTDAHAGFRQYLKTSRMGSAIYAPMLWRGEFLGQLVMAAQARGTMRESDLAVLVACAQLAAAVWVAQGGPDWLAAEAPSASALDFRRSR